MPPALALFAFARDLRVRDHLGLAEAARAGASEIAHKSMGYVEQNMAATFEFAQKLMHAKDPTELVRLQSEYLANQMKVLSTQAQDLGQSAAKIVMDAAKPKKP